MDTFVCSSWYYLRFPNPNLDDAPFNKDLIDQWLPVDQYVGGAEHAVMHLLYARFFTKVLNDLGYIKFDEPFSRLMHQGVITNSGVKMSKSKGNVINPDTYIRDYGSDIFRMYLMFMGAYTEGGDWSDDGIHGMNRFVNRFWRLFEMMEENQPIGNETKAIQDVERVRHNSVKMLTHDLDRFQFNTSISRIMELVNAMYLYIQNVPADQQNREILNEIRDTLIQLISPFTPHLGEELWERTGHSGSVFNASWPEWDEDKLKTDTITLAVQVNGKLRSNIEVDLDSEQSIVEAAALADHKIKKYVEGKQILRVIVVKNKLVNLVVQ